MSMTWLIADIIRTLPPLPDDAAACHNAVEAALTRAHFTMRREVATGVYDGARSGRCDLVGYCEAGRVAIEIDRRTPRKKSLLKLRNFSGTRIVLLRGHGVRLKTRPVPEGIDAVFRLRMQEGEQ